MSGSLNVGRGLGKWTATTANCSLGVGQSLLSYAGFARFLSSSSPISGGFVSQTAAGVFGISIGIGIGIMNLRGANALFSNSFTATTGKAFHFLITLNATGTSKFYINGVLVASASNIGATSGTIGAFKLGYDSTGTADLFLAKWAVWNGYEVPQDEGIKLRDGVLDPSQTATPATSYWLLDGTDGVNPVVGDPGLQDQIGANHLVTLPGTGGATANAIYSAADIVYHAPITVERALVTRGSGPDGALVAMMIGTNPLSGTVQEAYVTAISGSPTFAINGSPAHVSALSPIWDSSSDHRWPHVFYHITDPILPTDVITWTTPDGWLTAAQGMAADETGTAGNFAGLYEPGSFGYPHFDPAINIPRLQLGWNTGGVGGRNTNVKNLLRGIRNLSLDNVTSDANGFPLTILGSFAGTASALFIANELFNGVDNTYHPQAVGTYEFAGDEWAPGTPLAVTLTGSLNCIITGPTIIPGIIDGAGHEIGKRWQWDVQYSPDRTTLIMNLKINFQTPNHGAGPFTIDPTTMRLADPGSNTDAPYNNTINPAWKHQITAAPGVYAAVVRDLISFSGSDGAGANVFPSDLPQTNRFTYRPPSPRTYEDWTVNEPTFTGNREVPIHEIRKYDTSVNPFVYSSWKAPGCVASNIPDYPWMWDLHALGLNYDWCYPAIPGVKRKNSVVEWVCALPDGTPVKHNLQFGQIIDPLPLFNTPVQMTNDSGQHGDPKVGGGHVPIHITGPYTFINSGASLLPKSVEMAYVDSAQGPYIQNIRLVMVAGVTGGLRPEDFGAISAGCPGTVLWPVVNHCMNDDGVRSLATRLFDSCPPETKVIPEFSNEILIINLQQLWADQVQSLMGLTRAELTVQRTFEIQNIFADVFGEDRVIRVFQYFNVSQSSLFDGLTYAQAHSIPFDILAQAFYPNNVFSPSVREAAASVCLNQKATIGGVPTFVSVAHPSNGGHGVLFPMALLCDEIRFHLRYNSLYNGPNGVTQQSYNTLVRSGYGTGAVSGFVHPLPAFAGYECAVSTMIPEKVSTQTNKVRGGLTHDLIYWGGKPGGITSYYDVGTTFCQMMQQSGPIPGIGLKFGCLESLNGYRQAGGSPAFTCPDGADNLCVEGWFSIIWQNQQPSTLPIIGQQYYSTDLGGDGRAHDLENTSPLSRAALDWIALAAGFTPPPAGSFTVSPTSIRQNQPGIVTLTIVGTNTAFTANSVILVGNSVAGITNVVAVSWNRISNTSATLAVTVGPGSGIWQLVIDGVISPALMVARGATRWLPRLAKSLAR